MWLKISTPLFSIGQQNMLNVKKIQLAIKKVQIVITILLF